MGELEWDFRISSLICVGDKLFGFANDEADEDQAHPQPGVFLYDEQTGDWNDVKPQNMESVLYLFKSSLVCPMDAAYIIVLGEYVDRNDGIFVYDVARNIMRETSLFLDDVC